MRFFKDPSNNPLLLLLLLVIIIVSIFIIASQSRGIGFMAGPAQCVGLPPSVTIKKPVAATVITAGTSFAVKWSACDAPGPYTVSLIKAGSGFATVLGTTATVNNKSLTVTIDPTSTPPGSYYVTVASATLTVGTSEIFTVNSSYIPLTCTNPGASGAVRYCNEIFDESEIVVTSGITYSTIASTNLTFDLYTPPLSDTATNRPLEIFFPGGGGTAEGGAAPCGQAARLGYVCMSGIYRNDNSIPGFSSTEQKRATSDMHALIRFARLHASEYRIDPNKIMLAGVSAGGTTALEAATTGDNLDSTNWFPTSDPLINRTNATYSNGDIVPSWSCMAKSNSGAPMVSTNTLADAKDPPTVLFLGGLDLTHGWTCATGEVFTAALSVLGVPSYFQCFPGSDHSLNEDDAIDAVVIPMAYEELIVESCPQEYSGLSKIQ